jgi:arylsulfatase A-like enzyme
MLAERADARLFVWLHLMAPHQPFEPPATADVDFAHLFTDPAYAGPVDGSREVFDAAHAGEVELDAQDAAQAVALYDGEVAYVDRLVSRFAARLAALGALDEGLFVLAADHGEELGQRHAYWAHSKSVYGSVLHVPLLMRHPPTFAAGTVENGLVALEDVAPTVLELVRVPSRVRRQGRSLLPLFDDARAFEDRFVMGQWRDRIYTLRNRRWRLVWNPDGIEPVDPPAGRYPIPEVALYEVPTDPGETLDVAAEHPVLVRRLKEALNTWRIGLPPCRTPRPALDPARRGALRDLGYAGEDDPLDAARENLDALEVDDGDDEVR